MYPISVRYQPDMRSGSGVYLCVNVNRFKIDDDFAIFFFVNFVCVSIFFT